MNEVAMLCGDEPRKILQTVIEKKTPAIMTYLSGMDPQGRGRGFRNSGKWHVAKVLLTDLGANRFDVEVSPRKMDAVLQKKSKMEAQKPRPINIRVGQPVGISLKYGYGKFIFETAVVGLGPSPYPTGGGTIVLEVPDRIEIVQRRSYFRVDVPKSLRVNVLLWHRDRNHEAENQKPEARSQKHNYRQGRLIDISAGGAQIAVDAGRGQNFRKNQIIGMRFTPMPYEMPLMLNARIRNILPTADGKSICLGLQIVGLEASCEGQQVLSRLVGIVERYYQINQSGVKQHDMQPTSL